MPPFFSLFNYWPAFTTFIKNYLTQLIGAYFQERRTGPTGPTGPGAEQQVQQVQQVQEAERQVQQDPTGADRSSRLLVEQQV